ncbi:MAG: hypothetical protein HYV53_03245 [Parcubacteria group bacterium]|nr:hypothetical protein [Parcubacteria group bacterium]
MDSIKVCFDEILRGNKEKSRLAARAVRKLVYSSAASNKDKYEDIAVLVRTAPENYTSISEDWRQENFVMAVSVIYFLHDRENQPDFLFPWLFDLLQHNNGYIRHAAVRMIINEIGPLTVHIRCPGHKPGYFGKLTPEQADNILHSLFLYLHNLSVALWQPKYKRYKYIDSLPTGSYKSTQMVLAELEESCGRVYLDRLIHI